MIKAVVPGTLSRKAGYLRIAPKNRPDKPMTIKILGIKQAQRVADLVMAFSSKPPTVRVVDYR